MRVVVCLQVDQLTETPTTARVLTGVGFARGVCQGVCVEVRKLREPLVANITLLGQK